MSKTADEESRKFARHARILPVTLDWLGKNGRPTRAEGLMRDISGGGMFVHSNRRPAVGTVVHYHVFLPPARRMGPMVQIAGPGKIVRLETLGGGARWHGVAVRFEEQMIRVTPSQQRASARGKAKPDGFDHWLQGWTPNSKTV